MDYVEPFAHTLALVKPERAKKSVAVRSAPWWQYWRRRPALLAAIEGLQRVIALTRHSKIVMPLMVSSSSVFSDSLIVFATADSSFLALLSSSPHYWWAVTRGSTLETRVRYTPSDVFETFVIPELTRGMSELGDRLDRERRDIMLSRNAGLTATYNLIYDPKCVDADITALRDLHREIDEAVCLAYGWDDLVKRGLAHGFHPAGTYLRYTVGPAAQREIVDRLLELNRASYAEEVAKGLHDKRGGKAKSGTQASLFEGMGG